MPIHTIFFYSLLSLEILGFIIGIYILRVLIEIQKYIEEL